MYKLNPATMPRRGIYSILRTVATIFRDGDHVSSGCFNISLGKMSQRERFSHPAITNRNWEDQPLVLEKILEKFCRETPSLASNLLCLELFAFPFHPPPFFPSSFLPLFRNSSFRVCTRGLNLLNPTTYTLLHFYGYFRGTILPSAVKNIHDGAIYFVV